MRRGGTPTIYQVGEKKKCLATRDFPDRKMSQVQNLSLVISSLPGAGPHPDVNFLYKCRFPFQEGNFHSVFRASCVSAVS